MKKKYIITLILSSLAIILFVVIYQQYFNKKTELKISFICSQKHNQKDLSGTGSLNSFDWIILSDSSQCNNWRDDGYVIPECNFAKNYMIISKFKIKKLYQKSGCNECTGVPDGDAVFDKENSDNTFYYFYLMPKVMLSQGVG